MIIRCFGLLTQKPRKRDNSKGTIFRCVPNWSGRVSVGAHGVTEKWRVSTVAWLWIYPPFNHNLTPTSWAQCVQLLFHFIRWNFAICSTFPVPQPRHTMCFWIKIRANNECSDVRFTESKSNSRIPYAIMPRCVWYILWISVQKWKEWERPLLAIISNSI